MLTLARLEQAEPANGREVLNLLAEVRRELAGLMPLADEAQAELALEADEALDWRLPVEPGALGMLVQNLVANALRHAPAGSTVALRLGVVDDGIELVVADHGPGVPEASRALLGQRFLRLGGGSGAGLGLSIVRRVVERHGGRLAFDETPGGGLTVRIVLPRTAHTIA